MDEAKKTCIPVLDFRMNERKKVAPTGKAAGIPGQSGKSQQRRTFTVTAATVREKPALSKVATKVQSLGTLPKYLQKQPQPKHHDGLSAEAGASRPDQRAPAEPVPEPDVVLPSSEADGEDLNQKLATLQRTVNELWDELAVRENTVHELEKKLQSTRANLTEMENLMREHLHRRGDWLPDMKGNQTDGKITLLMLKMTLDTWPGCSST